MVTLEATRTKTPETGLRQQAQRLTGAATDYDPILDLIGDVRLVLISEASHGTHEFYRMRAELTQRLVEDKGFQAVAVEVDWPDAYRVNRCVRGTGDETAGADALEGFKRFPTWMWRNADVLDFVGWLREHNADLPAGQRAGFYGLDLYSLHASIEQGLPILTVSTLRRRSALATVMDASSTSGKTQRLMGMRPALAWNPHANRKSWRSSSIYSA